MKPEPDAVCDECGRPYRIVTDEDCPDDAGYCMCAECRREQDGESDGELP